MRKTKIVCTLGPNSSSNETIEQLIKAGMDIARFNFSHGSYLFYRALTEKIRIISSRLGKQIALLQDLQGPKIRTGVMKDGSINLINRRQITITTRLILGTSNCFSTQYSGLPNDIKLNDLILLDDGKLILKCLSKTNENILCDIIHGGILGNNKGINIPKRQLTVPNLTKKDIKDIKFGFSLGLDAIALSFVQSAKDIINLKKELSFLNYYPLILAKVEKEQAIQNQDEIIAISDGIMIARGDLGVEMPIEKIPSIQKEIIINTNKHGKPVIVATQMLESMIKSPIPTRAETSDVANAVIDGADMLMLSGETANGDFPVNAVRIMNKIILQTENSGFDSYWKTNINILTNKKNNQQNAISLAAVRTAEEVNCSAIVIFSASLSIALFVSNYRPKVPIFAFVSNMKEERKVSFIWGIKSEIIESPVSIISLWMEIQARLIKNYKFKPGQSVVLLTKFPFYSDQQANILYINTITNKLTN